jgi:hypothetical protein
MRGGQWQVLKLLQGLGAGNTLLAPAESPLLRAAQAAGLAAQPLSMFSLATLSRQADLVHAHCARSHTWSAAVSPVRLVVSRRVAFPVGQSFVSRWKYRRPNRFLAVSEHVKQALVEAEVPEARISVVYDGVDVPSSTASGDLIFAPGTADAMKGSDLVREAAVHAGVAVHFSQNLESDLPQAAILVYITRSEGLGSAALLAMAHGVPVVASRVGGLPEVVRHEENGILTDNEPVAIAKAIARCLERRRELGRAARETVEKRFSCRHMVEGTREVYSQVLAC